MDNLREIVSLIIIWKKFPQTSTTKKIYVALNLLFLLALAGCSTISKNVPPENGSTLPPRLVEKKSTAGTIITQQSTGAIPTKVLVPVQRNNPTTTNIKTTAQPTLRVEDQKEYLYQALHYPDRCSLPCWWGIEPGASTWEDALGVLHFTGKVPSVIRETGHSTWYSVVYQIPEEEAVITNTVTINEKDGIASRLKISAEGVPNNAMLIDYWENYSINQIFKDYGKPSRIWIETSLYGEKSKVGYDLWVFYDELGFLIVYSSLGDISDEIIRFCPTTRNSPNFSQIHLALRSPKDLATLEYLIDGYSTSKPYTKSLDEATNYSVDTFYEYFLNDTADKCFETPISIWIE